MYSIVYVDEQPQITSEVFFDDVTMKYDEEIKMKDDATFAVIISCNYY